MKTKSASILTSALFLIFCSICLVSCKTDPIESEISWEPTLDAGEAIVSSLGGYNGCLFEQMGDASLIADTLSLDNISEGLYGTNTVNKTYDDVNNWWNIAISRERNLLYFGFYLNYNRVFRIQYLKNNIPQKFWAIPNGSVSDTADKIIYNTLSGSGYHLTPRVASRIDSIQSLLIITNVNKDTLIFNGTAAISGVDTILTRVGKRIAAYKLTLNFINVEGLRISRYNLGLKGTITGTYTATMDFLDRSPYEERNIYRTFTITFGGENNTILNVGGMRFKFNPMSGVITSSPY